MKPLLFLLMSSLSLWGYAQENVQYEYMSMTQVDERIKINKNSESFEEVRIRDEKENDAYDYRPLLKRIEQLEKEGWELVANNVYVTGEGTVPRNYVLMRRKKE